MNRTITVNFPQHSAMLGVFYFMKYKNWSEYKIFCSKISTLMTRPRKFNNLNKKEQLKFDLLKSITDFSEKQQQDFDYLVDKRKKFLNPPVLSECAKSYLVEMYCREKYGLRNAISGLMQSSSRIKGFALEKEGLSLLSKIDNVEYIKNTDIATDDYLIGVCDTMSPVTDSIIDIKTSWNAANFMKTKTDGFKLPNAMWSQMQGYLHLYEKRVGEVCFVLVNTPEHLIEQEYSNLFKRYTYGGISKEVYDEACYKLDGFFDYNKIPEKKRIVRFEIKYSKQYIDRVRFKLEIARKWLLDFDKRFMSIKPIQVNTDNYLYQDDTDLENEEAIT